MLRRTTAALCALVILEAPAAGVASLATGRDGRGGHWFGVSWNKSTAAEAENGALNTCNQRGNCDLRLTFTDKCFAIVFGRLPDGRAGYEWLTTTGPVTHAETEVVSRCRNRGGRCELKKSFCDTTNRNPQQPSTPSTPTSSGNDPPVDGGTACKRYPNLC
jgi:hypothetical protein